MAQSKSTPGPWYAWQRPELQDTRLYRLGVSISNTKGEFKQHVKRHDRIGGILTALVFGQTMEECKANAKLIAAAPELLNVLTDARELLKDWGIDEEAAGHALLYRIESVIKKATE